MTTTYIITLCLLSAVAGALGLSIFRPRSIKLDPDDYEDMIAEAKAVLRAKAQNQLSEIACRVAEMNKPVPLCPECRKLQEKKDA